MSKIELKPCPFCGGVKQAKYPSPTFASKGTGGGNAVQALKIGFCVASAGIHLRVAQVIAATAGQKWTGRVVMKTETKYKTTFEVLAADVSASVGVMNTFGNTARAGLESCRNSKTASAPKWKKKQRKTAERSRKVNRRKHK